MAAQFWEFNFLLLLMLCSIPFIKAQNITDDEITIRRVIRQISFPGSNFNGNSGGGNQFNQNQCRCVPIVNCAGANQLASCTLPGNSPGACCNINSGVTLTRNLFTPPRMNVPMGQISSNQLNSGCQKGRQEHSSTKNVEQQLLRANRVVERRTPARNHFSVFRVTRESRRMGDAADEVAEATKALKNNLQLSDLQSSFGLRQFSVSNTILANNCPTIPRCNPQAKYRTIDGSCNNLQKPLHGKSNTPFQRILPPKYDDGIWDPRQRGVDGSLLPNPRLISNSVLLDSDTLDENRQFTLSVMQWGQFIDHDVTLSPFKEMLEGGEALECCVNNRIPQQKVHRYCDPIPIENDRFFNPKGVFCMNFVRSMLALDESCQFGHAEQINTITHWLDGSNIYGSTDEEARNLRSGIGGQLKLSNNNQLPFVPNGECEGRHNGAQCFAAGDTRVNEQPGLTAIHTVWHREHNRVARELQQLNPQWSDEALYQEARRIVVAEYQHIIYNEWLPIILGPTFVSSFGLSPLQFGQTFDYNPNINPQVNNEFSTGAFRFGHTLVQGQMRLYSPTGRVSTIRLRDHFNSAHMIQRQPDKLDAILRSLTKQPIQSFDSLVTVDLINNLFQTSRTDFGMDLITLNINRGRDHAIATYNEVREICGLPRARSFNDLRDQIGPQIIQRMQRVYKSVDDIDYFVGGISENPISGGLLGWTFLCVVGDQFARFKKADRFFYDVGNQPHSFNDVQLQEIRKASWARILCDNGDNIQQVQPLAMRLEGGVNQAVPCNSGAIPRVNTFAWRGEATQG